MTLAHHLEKWKCPPSLGSAGLEPTTLSLGRSSSIQLSYDPSQRKRHKRATDRLRSTLHYCRKQGKCTVDSPPRLRVCSAPTIFVFPRNASMSTSEETQSSQQQSLTPEKYPFTAPELMNRYVTDTGKILPRKYTHLSAKQQRAVTRTIKQSRNTLLAL